MTAGGTSTTSRGTRNHQRRCLDPQRRSVTSKSSSARDRRPSRPDPSSSNDRPRSGRIPTRGVATVQQVEELVGAGCRAARDARTVDWRHRRSFTSPPSTTRLPVIPGARRSSRATAPRPVGDPKPSAAPGAAHSSTPPAAPHHHPRGRPLPGSSSGLAFQVVEHYLMTPRRAAASGAMARHPPAGPGTMMMGSP